MSTLANKTDAFGFEVVTNNFWVPETEGELRMGVITGFEETETVHGTAEVAVLVDYTTREEFKVIIGGGLLGLKNLTPHELVKITFEGEKINPSPKKGRSAKFKAFQLERATKFDEKAYQAWVLA